MTGYGGLLGAEIALPGRVSFLQAVAEIPFHWV